MDAATCGILGVKFKLGAVVWIHGLKCKGRVLAIYISETGVQYSTRYFDNGEAKVVYFYEDELVERQPDVRAGGGCGDAA